MWDQNANMLSGDGKAWDEELGRSYSTVPPGSGEWEAAAPDLVSLDQLELDLLLGEVEVTPGAEADIRTLTHRQPHPPGNVHPFTPHVPNPQPIDADPVKTQEYEHHQPGPEADVPFPGKERRSNTSRKRTRSSKNTDCEPEVAFHVSEHDLELATAKGPGGEKKFDPRKVSFKEEDLKPQPMLKKSKKVFVPDSGKDNKYWERRMKNNMAAKRSRDARRVKENQVLLRVAFLEKENDTLREKLHLAEEEISALQIAATAPANEADMDRMREENARLRHALSKMTEILKCL